MAQNDANYHASDEKDEGDASDDEEIIRLEIARLEAQLKLKRSQKRHHKRGNLSSNSIEAGTGDNTSLRAIPSSDKSGSVRPCDEPRIIRSYADPATCHSKDGNATSTATDAVLRAVATTPTKSSIQVKQSPSNLANNSPSRITLGIDKGLKGKDMSLARPRRCKNGASGIHKESNAQMKSSFAQKLRDAKEVSLREEQHRQLVLGTQKTRSWSLAASANANDAHIEANQEQELKKISLKIDRHTDITTTSSSNILKSGDTTETVEHLIVKKPRIKVEYCDYYLSRQDIPTDAVQQSLGDKQRWSISDFFAQVRPPDYEVDLVEDIAIIAVVAAKSDIKETASDAPNAAPRKFCVLTLTDFKLDAPLFLFGAAFEKYWRLQRGQVIAVLNPDIMKPRRALATNLRASGPSMKLATDYDALLEIGVSSDLEKCAAMLKSGKRCSQWVDLRHTQFCEYHVDMKLDKVRSSRMELQSSDLGRPMFSRPKRFSKQDPFELHKLYEREDSRIFGVEGDFTDNYIAPSTITDEEKRAKFRRQSEVAENERRLLTKLRPRERCLDYLGIRKDTEDTDGMNENAQKPFTARALRRMGFDPTKSLIETATQAEIENFHSAKRPNEITLSPVKRKRQYKASVNNWINDSSSDDLEIV